MTLEDILRKGYFPKELPPPFNTELFADYFMSKSNFTSYKGNEFKSKYTFFSIPKIGYSRTKVSLVNPYNFLLLAELIANNWTAIQSIYNRSTITTSLPKINGSRFKTQFSFNDFLEKALIESLNTNTLLATDISSFYSSIYTHSIPWAIHTKEVAKVDRSNTLFGNAIDTAVRNCQDQQTNGVPVGPITSLIIAEILLCNIDHTLANLHAPIKGKRYIDDYMLFFKNEVEAEEFLKNLQQQLLDFQLGINNNKTRIEKLPYILDDVWITELSGFLASSSNLDQRSFLTKLYTKALELVKKYPHKYIIKYLIQVIKDYYIEERNWSLFQTYLLNLTKLEPSILPDSLSIIISYNHVYHFSLNEIRDFFTSLIEEHLNKGNHYEVSWSLWIFVELNMSLEGSLANEILASSDVCSKIILLHLESLGLIFGTLQKTVAQTSINQEDLYNQNWIYIYESYKKGWLNVNSGNHPVENDRFFLKLFNENISFYDVSKRVERFNVEELSVSDLTKIHIESDSIRESISLMKDNISGAESFDEVKEAFNEFLDTFESFVEELDDEFSAHIQKLIKKKREY